MPYRFSSIVRAACLLLAAALALSSRAETGASAHRILPGVSAAFSAPSAQLGIDPDPTHERLIAALQGIAPRNDDTSFPPEFSAYRRRGWHYADMTTSPGMKNSLTKG